MFRSLSYNSRMNKTPVIAALEKAVESSPDDVDLRLHLVQQLCEQGMPGEALQHCAYVLDTNPAHLPALTAAASAAREAGDDERAAAYSKLAAALSDEDNSPVDVPAVPLRADGPPDLRVVGGAERDVVSADKEPVDITLDHVAGLADVKERLELAFLGPIRNPDLAKAYGKKMRGGLMLYGPPGCGKTYIARALAGELKAKFMSIAINDVLDMWLGESEKRLHAIFEAARESAPTVLFFDELDAIGRKRSSLGTSASREVVNQLLAELDGMATGEQAVFVLGATNLPWDVDTALKRPGRFDRSIFVTPPDDEARHRILELCFEERPAAGLNLSKIVKATSGFSGADVTHVCDAATEQALARAMKSGAMEPITQKDIERSMKQVRPSIGKWFQTAKNHAMFANSSGEFNDLVEYMTKNRL